MLDTTRAVSPSTRHSPFKLDDRSIPAHRMIAIARAHRMEPPTCMIWLDPGPPLTQHSISACKRTYLARGRMLKESKEKQSASARPYLRPNAPYARIGPHRSFTSTSCSDIPHANPHLVAGVRLGTRAALPVSEYHSPIRQHRHPESNGRERADRIPIRPPLSIAACANSTLASRIWLGTVSEEDGAARGRDPDT
ncbi:hypothetical protein C8J57DRAFT_1257189 [Mycena rebaudengoi]|nr:hypothetical protein C8J57DRAFT_1257189 [Mycena rebaudengoi]